MIRTSSHSKIAPRRARTAAALLAAGCIAMFAAGAAEPNHVAGEVLAKFRDDAGFSLRQNAVAGIGADIVKTHPVLGYVKLALPSGASVTDAVEFLSRQPAIEWAEPNGYYYAFDCPDCPQDPYLRTSPSPDQWGAFKTGVQSLWRHGGGGDPSIILAIVDTGIDNFAAPHPGLAANVLGTGHDFVDDDATPTDAGASAGHGTHVAGIAAAVSDAAGTAGVAYCSKIMVVRVLDCTAGAGCPGSYEDIADGIAWAADNGARVINLSLGGPSDSYAVKSAVLHALAEGCIVVAATGNDGAPMASYPARYPWVVGVGSTNASDAVAASSNYGEGLDVVAPGVSIYSTVIGGGYGLLSGTSMASPFVAGIAALVAARNPDMGPLEFEPWIESHTRDLPGTNDGNGRVDFTHLSDVSDAMGYPVVRHDNFAWEWLGKDATAESTATDPYDEDGRPNMGADHDTDGSDDGVFPGSFPYVPFLPPHLAGAAEAILATMSVCDPDGPRYGATPDKQLHFDAWFDWNTDGVFAGPASDHEVVDHTENPAGWGVSRKEVTVAFTPLDEHLLGNPLNVRSRLAYGASVGAPDATPAATGEVEDDRLINFVEEFDTSLHLLNPGLYMVMGGGWVLNGDPNAFCLHHGTWEFAATHHPGIGVPCNGVIEGVSIMSTPVMDLKEYTKATLGFWYCHNAILCGPGPPDRCRVRVLKDGAPIDLGPIPIGAGLLGFDLTPFVGSSSVVVQFLDDTDRQGWLAVDDVIITALDDDKAQPVGSLAVSRIPGMAALDLTWIAPRENVAAGPPANLQANVYQFRYATTAIASEADWEKATPFTLKDGAIPPVAVPGTSQSATFEVPSAYQEYYVAMMTDDEVVNRSDVSNSPGDASAPVVAVTVTSLNDTTAAPGETVPLYFEVANTGTIADTYSLEVAGTMAWALTLGDPALDLPAGADSTVAVLVAVPGGATDGEMNLVTLAARSLSKTTVQDSDIGTVTVEVEAGTSVAGGGSAAGGLIPAVAGLRLAGAHPVRDLATLELALPRSQRVTARIVDVSGRMVRALAEGELAAGLHPLRWDLRNDRGAEVEAGVYFLDLRSSDLTRRERIVVAR